MDNHFCEVSSKEKIGPHLANVIEVYGNLSVPPKKFFFKKCAWCLAIEELNDFLTFDFSVYWKRYQGQGANQVKSSPLYRALNLKKFDSPIIWDTTCGTGKDALLILAMGVTHLVAFERNLDLALLLADALDRLHRNKDFGHRVFDFHPYDARDFSSRSLKIPDILYFDPMFDDGDMPRKKKSALPRKEMQFFRNIIGPSFDSKEFLQWAFDHKIKRIVVKRGIKARPLLEGVTSSFLGNSTRYDLYCR